MKIYFDVIGCRLNQSEVEGIANTFRALGHQIVKDPSQADLAIVNTCAVTVKAAADSRKKLRRAGREGTHTVVATGCWATLYPEKALELPGVTAVYSNEEKNTIVSNVLDLTPESLASLDLVRKPLPGDRARTRAFIKVQEGCDNHCTYCLTRLARGKSRSRNLDEIAQDIRSATLGGVKEIVLTGVQLGAWGRDLPERYGLGRLLASVLELAGFDRLRLSSIEPWDFDLEMLSLWQDKRLCRHFHIPLQSGDDRVLEAMGRPITVKTYERLIEKIRNEISEVALTTDVICGFPGETEVEFSSTQSFIQSMGFSGGHVFTYSPRPGTAAINMKGQVLVRAAKSRNANLRKIFNETGRAYRDQFVGRKMPVLWESSHQDENGFWQLSGLTDTYIRVYSKAKMDLSNQITPVRLQKHHSQNPALIGFVDNEPGEN